MFASCNHIPTKGSKTKQITKFYDGVRVMMVPHDARRSATPAPEDPGQEQRREIK